MADGDKGSLPVRMHHPNGDVTDYGEPVRKRPAPTASAASSIGLMVFAGMMIALFSMGIRNIVPLWQTPMLQDLGWTSVEFSFAIGVQNLMWGFFAPVFGGLADKYGARTVLVFGALLQAGGIWVMSQASTPQLFFVSAGLMLGFAQSAAGMGIVLGAVGRVVHERHRTMAFGLITSASSAGMIVLTPVGEALLTTFAWSDAFVWLAALSLPMVVFAFFINGRKDEDDPSTAEIAKLTVGAALSEAFRHRGYLLLVLGFFVCGFHVTFIAVHLPKYLNDIGLGWELGAKALMIIGVFNVAACLAVGVVATWIQKRTVLAIIYLLRGAVILGFVMAPPSEWSVYLFAAGIGVLWLSTIPPTQAIVAQVFGTQYMTMLFGVAFLSHQLGSFLGVYLGAEAVDRLGSYELVWYAAVALGIFAAICHILIDERPIERSKAEPAPAE